MIQRGEPEAVDPDERLGEAIEAFLALAEEGHAPDPEEFVARYPDIGDELREALDGLALVRGLVGEPSGPGHRLESGRRIAGYRIVRELGRGGMGTVYEAVHVGLDRPVALKVLGHHAAPDSSGRRRFLNEARTAAGLHHTHIVPVYDVGQVGGLCYYAMQRIEGSGLDRVLRFLRRDRTTAARLSQGGSTANRSLKREAAPAKSGDQTITWGDLGDGGVMARGLAAAGLDQDDEPPPFEPPGGSAYYRWIAEVGREAAEALAHAHQRGVVHRDVKPSNLLVDARGFVWVADFGLARRLADPSQTQHDSLLGTPRYMSPEQAGIGPIDGRSDIYSLGATLYELLTLRPPFEGQTAAELVDQITSREPAAPRQFDPRIPRDLETIVLKALAKVQEDRYALATDLADDLGRFLSHEPVRARRIGPLGRLWRFARRHPSLAAVSTAAAAIVVTVAAVAHVRVVHERNQAIAAKNEAQAAMLKIEAANRKTREVMRAQLWREASVVRLSNVANRRVTGLGLLRDAAAMDPDPGLRARLRDEAIEFLVLRDIERRPDFASGPARGLTFDPRGSRLATLSEDGEEFRLWDVATRRCLDAHPLRVGPVPPPPALAADPATGRPAPAPHRRRGGAPNPVATVGPSVAVVLPEGLGLRFFNATTGAPLHDLELSGRRLLSFLATPDGHRLVTVERSSDPVPGEPNSKVEFQVNLWDPGRNDQPVATLSRWESTAAAREMPLIAMAPDDPTVAVARSRKMSVSLWSVDDGRSLGTIETQTELSAVALGHAGLLATAGGGAVRLWDLDARTSLPGLDSHLSFVRTLRFNPKGTLLAVAGMGSDIEVWDVASRTVVAELPTPDRVEDLAFAPGGHLLAAATSGASTAAWTVLDPLARVQLSGCKQPPTSLAFRGDDLLAMATRRGSIRFWSPGHCLSMTPQSGTPPSDGLVRDEPTALIFDGGDRLITLDAQTLRVWPHPPAREGIHSVTRTEVPGGVWTMFPAPIARASGGRSLFVARGARVLAWDPESPDCWSSLSMPPLPRATHTDAVRGWEPPLAWRVLAVSPAGDRLYLLDQSGSVHALALEGTTARRLDWILPIEATGLALSPDGATLALGDRLGSVALVDTTRGTIRSRLRPTAGESDGRVAALAFAPDGRTLAVGSLQGPVALWAPDAPSAPLARLPGHRGLVITLAFAPEGRYLATGGADKLVNIWDLECLRRELGKLGLAW